MVEDPYKVLGIFPDATEEQIRTAFHKKAKEFHPDLHPGDRNAEEKFKEVNEAYDMLCNPHKYKSFAQQSSPYFGGRQGQTEYDRYQQRTGGDWSTQYYGFDDFFNMFFGAAAQQNFRTAPYHMPGDSPEIDYAIDAINSRMFRQAITRLETVEQERRTDRWYYVCAVAHYGAGDAAEATANIRRAMEIDSSNSVYHTLFQQYSSTQYRAYSDNRAYSRQTQQNRRHYPQANPVMAVLRLFMIMMLLNFLFGGLGGCMFFFI